MAGLSCHSLRNSILLVHLLLHFSETELIGPKQPIIAAAGEDVTLPCHLVQVENVATQTLEWTRPDLDPRFVFVWRSGQDFINLKNPAYKGRSSLFTDELRHGNISLKLSKVKPADEGRYRCFIPYKNEEAFVDLLVGAVSSPVIIIDRDKVGVILECKSEGWYPKPEVHWLDFKGNVLPAGPTETPKGPDDLYSVSSKVTVEKKWGNNFTCRVEQKNINQSRETHIQISDEFMVTPSSGAAIIIGLAVSLALSVMLILTGVFIIWRQNKTMVKRDHCDESGEQEMKNRSKNDKTETEKEKEKEKLMRQDIVQALRNFSNEEKRRKEAENEAESMRKKVDHLMAEVEKLKNDKKQLQHLLYAKEQKHETLLMEKNQEADKKLKETEELKQQLEKKDAEIRELKKQLDKNQEPEKKMKEENQKLKFQMERKSSRDKTVKKSESRKLHKLQSDESLKHFQEQNQSSSANHSSMRGDIILEELDRYGNYLCLKNISSEDKIIGGWELKLQINQTQLITYKFRGNYKLKTGRALTLRQPGTRNPHTDNDDLMWEDMKYWSPEDNLKISLISNTGEEHTLN